MAKVTTRFRCSACGAEHLRWVGRRTKCQEFGTVDEAAPTSAAGSSARTAASKARQPARTVSELHEKQLPRQATGVGECDRVLGGGLVAGQVVLLAGEPGVGKSTLLLSVAQELASQSKTILYITGEESAHQIGVRARR